jgi:hypothetical protein
MLFCAFGWHLRMAPSATHCCTLLLSSTCPQVCSLQLTSIVPNIFNRCSHTYHGFLDNLNFMKAFHASRSSHHLAMHNTMHISFANKLVL